MKKEGIFIFLLSLIILVASNLEEPGITNDEIWYFDSAKKYTEWFLLTARNLPCGEIAYPFKEEVIKKYWQVPEKHPPLGKIIMGITYIILHKFTGDIFAYRFSSAILFSLLVAVVYIFAASKYGRRIGIFSALSLFLSPRVFGHAHLAALDLTVAFFWFLSAVAFFKGIHSLKWSIIFGIIFGLSTSVKSYCFFIPLPLFLWGVIYYRKELLKNAFSIFISPFVFFILWPLLWNNPYQAMVEYLRFSLTHSLIPIYYLEEIYINKIPLHYPPAIIFLTLSSGIALMSVVGILRVIKNIKKDKTGSFFLIQGLFPLILAIIFPVLSSDGERHFLQAFPFIAVLSGLGLGYITSIFEKEILLQKNKIKKIILSGCCCLIIVLTFADTIYSLVKIKPYYLSFYNGLVGGISGANKRGLETIYWWDACNKDVLNYLNKNASYGAKIGFYPTASEPILKFYQKEKMLRADLQFVVSGIWQCTITKDMEYLVGLSRQSSFNNLGWLIYKFACPVFEIKRENVPILRIYKFKKLDNYTALELLNNHDLLIK